MSVGLLTEWLECFVPISIESGYCFRSCRAVVSCMSHAALLQHCQPRELHSINGALSDELGRARQSMLPCRTSPDLPGRAHSMLCMHRLYKHRAS